MNRTQTTTGFFSRIIGGTRRNGTDTLPSELIVIFHVFQEVLSGMKSTVLDTGYVMRFLYRERIKAKCGLHMAILVDDTCIVVPVPLEFSRFHFERLLSCSSVSTPRVRIFEFQAAPTLGPAEFNRLREASRRTVSDTDNSEGRQSPVRRQSTRRWWWRWG